MTQSIDKSAPWPAREPGRLVQFVRSTFSVSASKAKTLIQRGHFTVDAKRISKPGYELKIGDVIEYTAQGKSTGGPFGVRKVFMDTHLVIVDKPSGLLSAPLEGSNESNALAAARRFCQHGSRGPKVVHRLDKSTSGLLAFGRGVDATRTLGQQLSEHSMNRTYYAVVDGTPSKNAGVIVSRLVSDAGQNRRGSLPRSFTLLPEGAEPKPGEGHGKWSATRYWVRWQRKGVTGLEIKLVTGRTHQIRIHLAELGTPVCGETVYGRTRHTGRLALHAGQLSLTHPTSGEAMSFNSPWPESLQRFWSWQIMDAGASR